MSSVSFSELFLLFIIGLLILGPERLPRVASQIGRWVGRARRTANQLRYQLEREIALADSEKKASKSKTPPADGAGGKPAGSGSSAGSDSTRSDTAGRDADGNDSGSGATASGATAEASADPAPDNAIRTPAKGDAADDSTPS